VALTFGTGNSPSISPYGGNPLLEHLAEGGKKKKKFVPDPFTGAPVEIKPTVAPPAVAPPTAAPTAGTLPARDPFSTEDWADYGSPGDERPVAYAAAPTADYESAQAAAKQVVSAKSGLRRKDFGSQGGYDAAVARQSGGDAAQPLGSGSSLRQAPVQLGTRSGAMRRAARSLRRAGAMGEANKMFGAAAAQKLDEPSIMTQEHRGRLQERQKQSMDLMARNQEMARQTDAYARKVMEARSKALNKNPRGAVQYQGLGPNPASNIGVARPYQGLGPNPASNIGVARPGQWTPQRSR